MKIFESNDCKTKIWCETDLGLLIKKKKKLRSETRREDIGNLVGVVVDRRRSIFDVFLTIVMENFY